MSIDLTKLTPAPWEVVGDKSDYPIDDRTVAGPDGVEIFFRENHGCASDPSPDTISCGVTDANFVALARNAFDVMMRRGWTAYQNRADHLWIVAKLAHYDERPEGISGSRWPDPFTALVEADEWYRENVEKQPEAQEGKR